MLGRTGDRTGGPVPWSASILAALVLALSACGGGAEDAGASPADGATVASTPGTEGGLQITVDPSALPTSPLERQAFVSDVCSFASPGEIGAFFTFHDGSVSMEGDDGFYAGSECAYAMQDPEVFLEIQFSQSFSSSTEEVELGGVSGILRNASGSTLENRARIQIPFRIEGSPIEALTVQFHVRGAPPADEESLRFAIDALGTNLIERLGPAELGR